MTTRPVVGVPMGDPAGVGPEIVLEAAALTAEEARVVVIGDYGALERAGTVVDRDLALVRVDRVESAPFTAGQLPVLPVTELDQVTVGEVSAASGDASLAYVRRAVDLAARGRIDAVASGPKHKHAIELATGRAFGEILAEVAGVEAVSILLAGGAFRVGHVTNHVPLRDACEDLTTAAVTDAIQATARTIDRLGVAEPRLLVAGLNPHAGDGGLIGDEDAEVIRPAVEAARSSGVRVEGPEPPDSVFVDALADDVDGVVAMYHDQGHIPFKLYARQEREFDAAGVFMNLPFPYTTVAHGTALDIAGTGTASAGSMVAAIRAAASMARRST